MIAGFDWLSDAQKKLIFEDNARRLFKLDDVIAKREAAQHG